MKKGLLIILFLGIIPQGFAQTLTPEFEFQLYFEDAVGNRDTVTLGYDALATAGIDADFGEENILDEPWGENLDVRLGNSRFLTDIPAFLSKKQIFPPFCGLGNSHQYPFSDEATIHFYTSNYPLTITWNQTLFENNTILSPKL